MRKRTDSELLEIITVLRNDYQVEAVIAAEAELKNRKLTVEQLAEIREQLDSKKQEQDRKDETIEMFQNKAKEISDIFNPIKEHSSDKTIKIITVALAIPYLIFFINNFRLIVSAFQDILHADFSVYAFLVPIILFPIGLFGFWTIKKYGWIIIAILATCMLASIFLSLALEIKYALHPPFHFSNSGLISIHPVHNSFSDQLFGKKRFYINVGQIIYCLGLIFMLNRYTITQQYNISKRTQWLTVGLTAIPFIIFGFIII